MKYVSIKVHTLRCTRISHVAGMKHVSIEVHITES